LLRFRICLVEYVVAKREEDRFAPDAFRALYHVWVMAENQVRPLFNKPSCFFPLPSARPLHKFVSPVDRNNNDVRAQFCQAELFVHFAGRYLLHSTIRRRNCGHRYQRYLYFVEVKELRRILEVDGCQSSLLEDLVRLLAAHASEVPGMIVLRGHRVKSSALQELSS